MKTTYSTLAQIRAALIRTTDELLQFNNQAFSSWRGARQGSDWFINEPERAARCHEAAEDGADGSTHAEHIQDFQDYADEHYKALSDAVQSITTDSEDEAAFEAECDVLADEIDAAQSELNADLERLEKWHADNGSLHQQVG